MYLGRRQKQAQAAKRRARAQQRPDLAEDGALSPRPSPSPDGPRSEGGDLGREGPDEDDASASSHARKGGPPPALI